MKLKYAASFERDLRSIKEQSLRNQVRVTLETLQGAPNLREVSKLVRFLRRKDIYRYFP